MSAHPERFPVDIRFRVYGEAAPGGSKRAFVNRKTGRVMITDAGTRNKPWRDSVAAAAREAYDGPVLTGPVAVTMLFHIRRPKSHYGTGRNDHKLKRQYRDKRCTRQPDILKLARAVEDALTGIIWADDRQIWSETCIKEWCDRSERPHVEVHVWGDQQSQ